MNDKSSSTQLRKTDFLKGVHQVKEIGQNTTQGISVIKYI